MRTLKHTHGKRLVIFILHQLRIKQQNTVPVALQKSINDCNTIEQLKDLLFSIKYIKDEAVLKAFDKRFKELEGLGL